MKTTNFLPLFAFFFSLVGSLSLHAQEEIQRHFATQSIHQQKIYQNTEWKLRLQQMEKQIADFTLNGLQEKITIPIVFHVVYSNEQEKISTEQIYSQLAALNRDFGDLSINSTDLLVLDSLAHFSKLRPDRSDISFCLANINGLAGINYVPSSTNQFEDDEVKLLTGATVINPTNVLNVWVAPMVDSISGYSQLPSGDMATDGIVIDYRFFGTTGTATAPYNNGSTLTHLVGSYLGLKELWSDTEPCGDDGVWDTPIHNAPNYGRITHYRHLSLCDGYPVEMTVNFMDNTTGGYMFTKGQYKRMAAVLSSDGARSGLTAGETMCDDLAAINQSPKFKLIGRQTTPLLNSTKEVLSFTIHPNPVKQQLNLQITQQPANVLIYSLSGKLLYQEKFIQQLALDCSDSLSNGRSCGRHTRYRA